MPQGILPKSIPCLPAQVGSKAFRVYDVKSAIAIGLDRVSKRVAASHGIQYVDAAALLHDYITLDTDIRQFTRDRIHWGGIRVLPNGGPRIRLTADSLLVQQLLGAICS